MAPTSYSLLFVSIDTHLCVHSKPFLQKETVSEPRNDTAEQGSENEESQGDSHEIEIPNDDLVVQILARLDGQAYRRALYQDAGVRSSCS